MRDKATVIHCRLSRLRNRVLMRFCDREALVVDQRRRAHKPTLAGV